MQFEKHAFSLYRVFIKPFLKVDRKTYADVRLQSCGIVGGKSRKWKSYGGIKATSFHAELETSPHSGIKVLYNTTRHSDW